MNDPMRLHALVAIDCKLSSGFLLLGSFLQPFSKSHIQITLHASVLKYIENMQMNLILLQKTQPRQWIKCDTHAFVLALDKDAS